MSAKTLLIVSSALIIAGNYMRTTPATQVSVIAKSFRDFGWALLLVTLAWFTAEIILELLSMLIGALVRGEFPSMELSCDGYTVEHSAAKPNPKQEKD